MKLVSYRRKNELRTGVVMDGRVLDVAALLPKGARPRALADEVGRDMTALIRHHGKVLPALRRALRARRAGKGMTIAAARLAAPLPRPGKILGIGRNYGAHVAEGGLEAQERPRIFLKAGTSVIGPGEKVIRPAGIAKLDYEAELAVVIGKRAKNVPRDQALKVIAGYTILNDVSAREFQFDVKPPQTSFAKSMDTFCPTGPWIVTADEIADPQTLSLRCWVNDMLVQGGSTSDMIFDIAEIVAHVSRYQTLEPGDLIATGTPDGVGAFRTPPLYLKPGDRVRIEIEGIGELSNPVA